MIKIAEVQFHPWDKVYDFYFDETEDIKARNQVVVRTELGMEVGLVVGLREEKEDGYELLEDDEREIVNEESTADSNQDEAQKNVKMKIRPILRQADREDLDKVKQHQKTKPEALDYCRGIIKRMELPMKLIDVHISFDGGRVTFAFIADGRVDFRELVKELTRHFQKSVRMQQLGTRDEAKANGDVGSCGRGLCCRKFLKTLGGVSSDLAANQQVGHRGSERLSGSCGRLMCCLRYENDDYVELSKNLPEIGSEINTPQGKGKVIGWHTLKQTVDVRIGEGDKSTRVEVEIKK